VAASLWYRLGALQEITGEHGSTHFLEHAVHQGTTTVGTTDFESEKPLLREIHETEQKLLATVNRERNRLRQRSVFHGDLEWPSTPEIDELRQQLYRLEDRQSQYREFWAEYRWYRRYGARSTHTDPVPATTGHEQLEIDIDLPKENLELFFRLEADRMANAVLRGWEAQRFTVLEQILGGRQRYDDPRGRFYEVVNGVTGVVHPIFLRSGGHLRDFAFYSRASMLRTYDEFFVPNNATLALVGDVSLDEVWPLAERYFGRIPRGAEPPARMDVEAEAVPGGSVRLDWAEPAEPRVLVRHRIPGVGHPDRPAFDAMAALADNVLRRKLSGSRSEASASRAGVLGTFNLAAQARRDEDLPAVEARLMELVEDLRAGRIDPRALERARTALRVDWSRTQASRAALAGELGRFQVMDSWKTLQPFVEARERATREDLRQLAQRYLTYSNRVIVTSRRKPAQDSEAAPGATRATGSPP
jgi:predicted Zn-dependent peptidase